MTPGYDPHSKSLRTQEEINEDEAREIAEVVVDEMIDRIVNLDRYFRLGPDLIAERIEDVIAGTDLAKKMDKRYRDLYAENKAKREAARTAAE